MNKLWYIHCALLLLLLASCKYKKEYDGLILTDENTGERYILRYNVGTTYFIDKLNETRIHAGDTIIVYGNYFNNRQIKQKTQRVL